MRDPVHFVAIWNEWKRLAVDLTRECGKSRMIASASVHDLSSRRRGLWTDRDLRAPVADDLVRPSAGARASPTTGAARKPVPWRSAEPR